MTYVRHCTQPSLAGLVNSTCSCPGTDVPGYFHSPLPTPTHEARVGDPGFGAPLYTHVDPDLTVLVLLRSGVEIWRAAVSPFEL
jgi:hypothetical protein